MAKPREKVPAVELSSAFQKKADLEFERLKETVARNLRAEMIGLLEDEIHSDLLITNGTVSVRAHKCIVQARSKHLWQENWLTQRADPDTSSDISCLEMPGLSGEQLTQFVRQLYSVSDAALLLEEYINYLPKCKESSSHLETRFNTTQPEMEGNSNSSIPADNIAVEADKEHITSGRTSQPTDVDDREKEESDLSVAHCEAEDNDHGDNRKSTFGGQPVYTDSKIVSLTDVSTEGKIVSAESKSIPSADNTVESKIVSLSDVPTERKRAHTKSMMMQTESNVLSSDVPTESKIVCTESKIVSPVDMPVESKIVSLPDALTEKKIVHTESKTAQAESKVMQAEGKVAEADSKGISLPEVQTESKTAQTENSSLSSHEVDSESKTVQAECKTTQAESKTTQEESKGLSSLEVHTESKTVKAESKTTQTESKTAQAESKTVQAEIKTTQAESKGLSSLEVHTESKTAQAESKIVQAEIKRAEAESKTTQAESKTVQAEIKTTQTESKTAQAESKTAQAESKTVKAESKTTQTESKTAQAESKTVQAESKTTQAESKTVQAESKTTQTESKTVQAESKGLSSLEVHTESKAVQAESKTTQTESKTVQAESKTAQAESKTAQAESKTVQAESKTAQAESKTVQAESKTAQAENIGLSSVDVQTESKTAQAESKTTQAESKTQEAESKTTQAEIKTTQAESKTPEAESKTTQAESKTTKAESKTTQAESKTPKAESKTPEAECKTTQAESKTAQAESKTTQAESKTTQAESKTTQAEIKTTQAESKTKQAESKTPEAEIKTTQAESKTTQAESKTTQAESKTPEAECKTTQAESKTTQAESKTTKAESKTTQAKSKTPEAESKTTQAESKTTQAESKTTQAESKTTQAESKTPEAESKTTQAESKTPEAESKTTQAESKTTQAESKTTQAESKTTQAESKTTQAESKTTQAESKTAEAESKTTKAESKTTQAESKTTQAESKTAEAESKTTQAESKTTQAESKTAEAESKTTQAESKTTQAESKGLSSLEVRTESKTTQAESKTSQAEIKTTQAESKGLSSSDVCKESKDVSSPDVCTESKTTQAEIKTAQAESKCLSSPDVCTESKTSSVINNASHTESKTVITESNITQVVESASICSHISEDCQVPLSSSAYGEGTELVDVQVPPEMIDSSICSAGDLVKSQLILDMIDSIVDRDRLVIDSSIVDKDRLELMDYLQLEAEIVSSACLADGTSVDSCSGEDLVNSVVSESLPDSAGRKGHGNEDGHLQLFSKILTETPEVVGQENASSCDLVMSDTALEQYKTCSQLGRDLLSMYLHNDNCDCCLSVDGVHFMAHKCVLSARCEYFLAMFGGQWSESQMATVNLEAVTPQAVRQLLLFLYGGVINLCVPSNLKELFIIADMYGVLTFRTVLAFYVKKDLCHFFHKPCPACVTTTSEALVLCHIFHLEDLQTRCLKWMSKYFTKVWPTKTFSSLEDSIHQLCFESILSELTASNVLDIIIECNKLISSLPRIKWTETVLYLVTRLMDAAIEYTSSHFVDVLKTKEFLLWAKVASWKASVLEEIFYSVINSLPVDTACLVFQTLIKLQEFHSNPESSDTEITALLQAMIKCCEKFFRTHIHHVTRSKQWAALPQQIQARILEISAYVYLPEPPGCMSSRSAANKPQVGKHERTLPIGITGARNRAAASPGTISAPARTGLAIKTSPHSGRRTDKSRETRMSRSISESLPSRNHKAGSSLKGTEVKVRASSRDRHGIDSSVQAGSLGRNDNQNGYHLFDPKLTSARDENQGTVLPDASHFGYQAFSHCSRPGAYFISKTETKKEEVRSNQDEMTEKVVETEGHGILQQVSNTLKLTLSSQSKSGNGTKKLSPVGQKSHMISKLPTLIRSQKQSQKQQSVCNTYSEVLASEHSSNTSIEKMQSESPSSPINQVTASDFLSSQSNQVIPPEHSSSTDIEAVPLECPPTTNSEVLPPERVTTSAPVDLVSTNTTGEGSISLKGTKDKACVSHAALPVVEVFSDLPMILPEPAIAPDKDLPLKLSQDNSDHITQSTNSDEHLPNKLYKDTSLEQTENANSNSQELSTAETLATLDFGSFNSDAILSSRTGDDHMTAGLEAAEVEAEVKIVHMSKTLNVGFIVPPD